VSLRIISTLAVATLLRQLVPGDAAVTYEPTAKLLARIAAGEPADLAFLTREAVQSLAAAGTLVAPRDVARSFVGLAVRAGGARPDISTVAALRATLLAAPSLAYSRAGASGIFFAGLIERLGIAQAVNARATVIEQGFTAALAASGEVALAVQQVSELMAVEGVDIVDRLPEGANTAAVFSAGIFADAKSGSQAMLQRLLAGMDPAALAAAGLEPA